jgi:hypothetical protein
MGNVVMQDGRAKLMRDDQAKVWLDVHMKYMPSDLADLRALLAEVRASTRVEVLKEAAEIAHQNMDHATRDALDAEVIKLTPGRTRKAR